jgi:hypothetical protein
MPEVARCNTIEVGEPVLSAGSKIETCDQVEQTLKGAIRDRDRQRFLVKSFDIPKPFATLSSPRICRQLGRDSASSQRGFEMPPLPETIIGNTCEGRDVTWAEIEAAANDVREWLKLKMTSGSCSTGLVYQLAGHYCRMPQMFGDRLLLVDIHAVFDQIGKLEKAPLTRAAPTKPAEPFTAGPLKGLWHKHWFQAGFLVTDLLNETEKHGEMFIRKHFDAVFARDRWVGELMTDNWQGGWCTPWSMARYLIAQAAQRASSLG